MTTQPKILIAGATGTNGRALITQLSGEEVPVRALVRSLESAADLAGPYVELAQGDLADPSSLDAAFKGIEKAYIVTAVHKDVVAWFDNFYAAAKKAGVKHLVKYSGYKADGNSKSEIMRQHFASDTALMHSGLTYTILRPNSFYQNMLMQAAPINAAGQFYLPLGDAKQSLVDVRDIAEVTARILQEEGHEGKIYNLTGPESLSFHDVAQVFSAKLGRDIAYVPVTQDDFEGSLLGAGMPEWDAHAMAEIMALFSEGHYAQPEDDLQTLLGRTPRTLAQFVDDHRAVFIAQAD